MSQYTVDTSLRMSTCLVAYEESTGPPRPSCTYPPSIQGTCMLACQLPKFKTNALPSSLHALDPPATTRQPHTRFLRHVFRLFALDSFSALHNISSSVLSDIIHSAFFGQPLRTISTWTIHPTTGAISASTTICFPSASAFWLHQKRLGTSVATPRVLG